MGEKLCRGRGRPRTLQSNKNDIRKQNFHHTQISSDIEICDEYAIDLLHRLFPSYIGYSIILHVLSLCILLFRNRMINDTIIGDEINDPIATV